MNVEVTEKNENVLMRVSGEVDFNSSIQVREKIQAATQKSSKVFVVDLSGVEYIDSSGLATLVEGMQIVTRADGKFILTQMNDRVKDVFELAHLDEVFEIIPTLDAIKEKHGVEF